MNMKVRKISPSNLSKLLKQEDIFVLDVRPSNYKNRQYLKNTALCPLVLLDTHYQRLPKDQKIVITDPRMKQSPFAHKFLSQQGYDVLGVLKGGVIAWKEKGFPVEETSSNTIFGEE